MDGIKFGKQRAQINALFEDWLVAVQDEDAINCVNKPRTVLESESQIQVSLLGEFSAGKSSLIAALTGAQVDIGADVTTQNISSYQWNGVTLVDTPGIQAQTSETDHDQIARDATIDADLILFVLTNELFNDRLASYFQFVAAEDGLALAKKMLVVVNKMDRESNPDEVIISEVEHAITPHKPAIALGAVNYYLKAQAASTDALKQRLIERSRVRELTDQINAFIDEQGALGRLTRPLQLFEEELETLRQHLLSDDEHARAQIEYLRRQKRLIDDAEYELKAMELNWIAELRHIVMSRSNDCLELIPSLQSAEELSVQFEDAMRDIEPDLATFYLEVDNGLRRWIRDLEDRIDELDSSPLGEALKHLRATTDLDDPFEDAPHKGFDFASIGKTILGEGMSGIFDSASKNPKTIRDFVYDVGKIFGKKWKPWEASKLGKKIAKYIGKGGKALPALTFALDLYMNYRDEKAQEEREQYLAKTRLNMQRQFREVATIQADALRQALSLLRQSTTHEVIKYIDNAAQAISIKDAQEADLARLSNQYIQKSRALRNSITEPTTH